MTSPRKLARIWALAVTSVLMVIGTAAPASALPLAKAAAEPRSAEASVAAPETFTHPGVLVSRSQLDFVRERVQSGAQPWTEAFEQMMASDYAEPDREPKPREVVQCGPYTKPNKGCTDEREDAIAAYTLSLAWYITEDPRYAEQAIEIMNAWSGEIEEHTDDNAPLQTAWAGSSWPRAAEIIRYTYGGWEDDDIADFSDMLREVYLPVVEEGHDGNGNWELSMTEAAIGISVFLEDREAYDRAVDMFRERVPAYIYLSSDGELPRTDPDSELESREEIVDYWQGQDRFVDGLTQETCRDFGHTGYGLSSISHVAETSRIQGASLYPEVGERLRLALGFHSAYENGAEMPEWLCGGEFDKRMGPITEVGYNALAHRLGHPMPETWELTERQRPAGTNNLFVSWETLTHAANPH
ncbi:alginate lyase family protein [Allonocardiopsis opalescens]|uniref:Alginate lyase n=1 Tax=Allonocardiopsis opalescens TaxID=1144618 RepID=A0A2T0Q2R6_9ACTN|nr:alginate lyase family protein [Allonocardiopsis opalescens]PRX98079.1 alginate lyase [Allonocardiopsis opalescens]